MSRRKTLGYCSDWCQHTARGNGLYMCWKCGHFVVFTIKELSRTEPLELKEKENGALRIIVKGHRRN